MPHTMKGRYIMMNARKKTATELKKFLIIDTRDMTIEEAVKATLHAAWEFSGNGISDKIANLYYEKLMKEHNTTAMEIFEIENSLLPV